MKERFEVSVGDFKSDLWRFHLLIPDEVSARFIDGNNRRVICEMPDGEEYQLALMPSGKGWYLLMNQKMVKKYHLKEGGRVSIVLSKDNSEFGMEVPEEFTAVLEMEPQAKQAFEDLTKGKQRSLIYIVNKVKSTDSRLRKALAIVQHLKEVGADLDYKRLNQLIKEYNNKTL